MRTFCIHCAGVQCPAIFCDMCCAMACNLNIQRYVLCVHRTLRRLLYRLVLCVSIHVKHAPITRRSKTVSESGTGEGVCFLNSEPGPAAPLHRHTGSSRYDRCSGLGGKLLENPRSSTVMVSRSRGVVAPRCTHQARLARASTSHASEW